MIKIAGARAEHTLPSLASVSPRYAKVLAKSMELTKRRLALEAELRELAPKVRALPEVIAVSRSPKHTVVIEPSRPAKELLGDLSPEPIVEVRNAPHPLRELGDKLGAELEAVREALEALAPELRHARLEASAALCDRIEPAYSAIADRFISAVVELGNAKIEHDDFVEAMRRTGAILSPLRPLQSLDVVGDPREPLTAIRLVLDWAVEICRCDPEISNQWRKN